MGAPLGDSYFKCHTVLLAAGAGVDYQVMIVLHYGAGVDYNDNAAVPPEAHIYLDSHSRSDFGDVRFTDGLGNLLDYWMESYTDSVSAVFWIEVQDNLTTANRTVCVYYGKPAKETLSDGDLTFPFFDDFHYAWDDYVGNPILSPTAPNTFACYGTVLKEGATWHMYYTYGIAAGARDIGHATSPDGKTWTKDVANNPVLTQGAGGKFDDIEVFCPYVWKEGATWNMLYTGTDDITPPWRHYAVGWATSADGITWTRQNGGNAVMTGGAGGSWDEDDVECWGIIKVGATYHMMYETVTAQQAGSGGVRRTGHATSTDLLTWTKDGANPIFADEICGAYFKRGIYYYYAPVVPSHAPQRVKVYRDLNPTFYAVDRTLVRDEAIGVGLAGDWDDAYIDCSFVYTDDINRDTYVDTGEELWAYYSGWDGAAYHIGMRIEHFIDRVITPKFITDDWVQWIGVTGWQDVGQGDQTIRLGCDALGNSTSRIEGKTDLLYYASRTRALFDNQLANWNYHYIMISKIAFAQYMMITAEIVTAFKTYSKNAGGTENTIIGTPLVNTNHLWEINWKVNEARFYIDNVLQDTDVTRVPTIALPIFLSNHNGALGAPWTSNVIVDWTHYRKYVLPEPTHGATTAEGRGVYPDP